MAQEFLTKTELMEYLRISRGTVDKLMRQRVFPYIKLGRKVLFRKDDIDKILEKRLIR